MRERDDLNREELLRAFSTTPPEFEAAVDETLRRLTHETEKTRLKRNHRPKLAFALALALVLVVGAAVAVALYPKTTDNLRASYGDSVADQVETYGQTVELGQSFTLGDIQYTFTDAVVHAGILYGTVVAEPVEGANVLLIAEDMDVNDPVGYNFGRGESAPKGAKSYAQTARETGARILITRALPNGLLVDGALIAGESGRSSYVTPDNTVVSTFELGGVQEADSYDVQLSVSNWEITPDGEWLLGETDSAWQSSTWDVNIIPKPAQENTAEVQTQNAAVPEGQLNVSTPNTAAQYGKLPVYELTVRNFMDSVDPAWFNQSGEASRRTNKDYSLTYSDGAELTVSVEALFYAGHEGTEVFHNYGDYDFEHPGDDLAGKLFALACGVELDERVGRREVEAPRDAIPAMTLDEAKAKLNELLSKLGIENTELTWSYGMDLAHINLLNEQRNAAIAENGGIGFTDPCEFSAVTEEDGGWLLMCSAKINGLKADASLLDVSAFVNKDGVAHLNLRSNYALGEVLETLESLLTAEEALAKAVDAAKQSWLPGMAHVIQTPSDAELIYAPETANGLRLVPTWRFTTPADTSSDFVTVDVSAVDGIVLWAPWM